jgi:hypothetical protein
MTWITLPEEEGDFSLNGNKVANSVGASLDGFVDTATSLNDDLSAAITALRDDLLDSIDNIAATFNVTLDTTTAFSAPTALTTPTIGTTPTGPSTSGQLLDDTAYTNAYALARDDALATQGADTWEAENAAAASGIGLPSATILAMKSRIQQARRQATSGAALAQATAKAQHLRDDRQFAYTYAIQVYQAESQAILSKFTGEIQNYQQRLAEQAQRLQWKENANSTELERGRLNSEDQRKLQEYAVTIGQQASIAYAAALAEQFKAWLGAASYSARTDASINNATYTG